MKLIIFASICAIICVIALISEYIVPYDPYAQDLNKALQSPSLAHFLERIDTEEMYFQGC